MKTMKVRTKVQKRLTIQIDYLYNGKMHRYSRSVYTAPTAAKSWADHIIEQWEYNKFEVEKYGAAYHRMTAADYDEKRKRYEKLIRRSFPIFEAMLK